MADECLSFQDGSQTSASSCDEAEIQSSGQEQAVREAVGQGTKTRRRCRTVYRNPDSQVSGSVQVLTTTCAKTGIFLGDFLFELPYDSKGL